MLGVNGVIDVSYPVFITTVNYFWSTSWLVSMRVAIKKKF